MIIIALAIFIQLQHSLCSSRFDLSYLIGNDYFNLEFGISIIGMGTRWRIGILILNTNYHHILFFSQTSLTISDTPFLSLPYTILSPYHPLLSFSMLLLCKICVSRSLKPMNSNAITSNPDCHQLQAGVWSASNVTVLSVYLRLLAFTNQNICCGRFANYIHCADAVFR